MRSMPVYHLRPAGPVHHLTCDGQQDQMSDGAGTCRGHRTCLEAAEHVATAVLSTMAS